MHFDQGIIWQPLRIMRSSPPRLACTVEGMGLMSRQYHWARVIRTLWRGAALLARPGPTPPPTHAQVCGGKVLRCLTDNVASIKAQNCAKEVYYYQKMEVSNYKNDIILAEACRSDVDRFCYNIPAGACGCACMHARARA